MYPCDVSFSAPTEEQLAEHFSLRHQIACFECGKILRTKRGLAWHNKYTKLHKNPKITTNYTKFVIKKIEKKKTQLNEDYV